MDVIIQSISDAFRQQNNGGAIGFALNLLKNDLTNRTDQLNGEIILQSVMNWSVWLEDYIKPLIKDFVAIYVIGGILMLVLPTVLLSFALFTTPIKRRNKNKWSCQMLSAILISLCYITTILFVLSLYENERFCQELSSSPTSSLSNDTTSKLPASLADALQVSNHHLQQYLTDTLKQCSSGIAPAVDTAVSDILALMKQIVQVFMSQLMQRYYVAQLFDDANDLFTDLNVVIDNIGIIKNFSATNLQSLWQFTGSLNMLRSNLLTYKSICQLPLNTAELTAQCNQIMTETNLLTITIDTKQIDLLSGPALVYMMDKLNFNLTDINEKFVSAQDSLAQILDSVKQQVVNLPLDEASKAIRGVCNSTSSVFQQILSTTSSLNTVVPQMTSPYVSYWSYAYIGVFCLTIICLCFIIIGGIYGIFPTILAAFEQKLEVYEDEFNSIKSSSTTLSPFENLKEDNFNLLTEITICNRRRNLYNFKLAAQVVPTAVAVLLILLFAMVMVSFLLGVVLNTDVCRYIAPNQNVTMLDSQLDQVIDPLFRTLLASLLDAQGHYTIKVQNISIGLNLHPPQHLLKVLLNECRVSNQSLLKQLGLTNVINVSALVYSDGIQSLLSLGKSLAKEQIGKLDVSSMIPTSLTSTLQQAQQVITNFIDNQNYNQSLTELSKPLTGLSISFADYLSQLQNMVLQLEKLYPIDNDVFMVASIFSNLKLLPYQQQVRSINTLRQSFVTLQGHRNIGLKLNRVSSGINQCEKILANKSLSQSYVDQVFNGVLPTLLTNMSLLLTNAVNILENSVGHCQQLSAALLPLQSVTCDLMLATWFYQVGMLGMASIFLLICAILLLCQSESVSIHGSQELQIAKDEEKYEVLDKNVNDPIGERIAISVCQIVSQRDAAARFHYESDI